MNREDVIYCLRTRGTIPKDFRIWDELHRRWFQGSTDSKSIKLSTDHINFFGEIMIMEGPLFDQNEDDVWKEDPYIKNSLDLLEHLIVVQSTGTKDETGRIIYEGDIVITDDNVMGYVAYNKDISDYTVVSPWSGTLYTDLATSLIKGNIFENYNLLEEP